MRFQFLVPCGVSETEIHEIKLALEIVRIYLTLFEQESSSMFLFPYLSFTASKYNVFVSFSTYLL